MTGFAKIKIVFVIAKSQNCQCRISYSQVQHDSLSTKLQIGNIEQIDAAIYQCQVRLLTIAK